MIPATPWPCGRCLTSAPSSRSTLREARQAGSRFAEQLELFSIAASLGSTESLVVPPALQDASRLTAEQQRWADIGPGTVRLSIGLEDVDDLIADLESALGQPELD